MSTATAEKTDSADGVPTEAAWSEVYEFLSHVVGEGKLVSLRPIEVWTEKRSDKPRPIKKSRVIFRAIDHATVKNVGIKSAYSRLLSVGQSEYANLFFGVCPRFGVGGRFEQAWQIRQVTSLWSDVDGCSPAEAIVRCEKASLPRPSIVVSSGNGAHLYWLLDEPYLIDDAPDPLPVNVEWIEAPPGKKKDKREWITDPQSGERLYLRNRANVPPLSPRAQHAQDVLQGIATEIGGDSTFDLSRLLRLPCTLNRKDQRSGRKPVLCEIVQMDADCRYSITDFEPLALKSPAKIHRERVAAVLLPAPKRLTPARRDKFAELVNACAVAPVGERSERDFDACCFAIRKSIPKAEAWQMLASVGKFAEGGERYFERTWQAAECEARKRIYTKLQRKHGFKEPSGNGHAADDNTPTGQSPDDVDDACEGNEALANFTVEFDDEGQPKKRPRPMQEILAGWRGPLDDWPRRVGGMLFVHEPDGSVDWLEDPAALFGMASNRRGVIDWAQGSGFVSKGEFFAERRRQATEYDAIETLPHFPVVASHYYTYPTPRPGSGDTLRALLDRFTYATEIDRDLHLAAFVTPFWGGPPGGRPMFVITSDSGRGSGKSKLVEMTALLHGGSIDFSTKDDIGHIKSRLLSAEGAARRIALLDNIKTLRFSWAELEGLITARSISGHRMYIGEGRRANLITWFATLNGASLSTDIAQRVVIVKLNRPTHDPSWDAGTREFITANHDRLIADVAAFFAAEASVLRRYSRWSSWEDAVLSRLPEPAEAQRVIEERQAEADSERDDHEIVEEFFRERLKELRYDPTTDRIFIPSAVCCRWLNWASNANHQTGAATRVLRQAATEGVLKRIKNCGRSDGRGFLWVGEAADPNAHRWTDLPQRIDELMKKKRRTDETPQDA